MGANQSSSSGNNYNQGNQQQQHQMQNQYQNNNYHQPQQQYQNRPQQQYQNVPQQQMYQQQYQGNFNQQQQSQQQLEEQRRQEETKARIYGNQSIMGQRQEIELPGEMYILMGSQAERYHMQNISGKAKAPTEIKQQRTVAVKNDLLINQKSIKLVKGENQPQNILNLEFDFTLNTSAAIGIYYCVTEVLDPNNNMTLKFQKENQSYLQNNTYQFQPGKDQKFPGHLTPLDTTAFSKNQLTSKQNQNYYNLVIRMEKLDKSTEFKVFYTYATLFYDNHFNLQVKVVKQKLELNGVPYILDEVYGINQSGVANDVNGEAVKECVICYTDAPDCIILPCKHMCLCIECCKAMRKKAEKCPMCRGEIKEYIQLQKADQNQNQNQQQQQQFQQ